VSTHTVQAHFGILVDTLLGRWLPSYTKRPKRRVIGAPKFYFFDVGIVNHLARRGRVERGGELFGKALENWVFHELIAQNAYQERFAHLSYWRLASGIEVDFIVDNMRVAIEVKSSARVTDAHLSGLRHLIRDHPKVERRILVCLEPHRRRTEDRIDILPLAAFLEELAAGRLF
jgi:predicted AAA+ superfamily ATPase